ncbi:MAG: type II toxin-antitoxin system HicB family antitoxin [Lentilactobacillus hilgardii]|jgi:predicted RNase H-like HicB family nuclease|uniref:type II toxin-antitoxin system HicB family antitoxin n=2 Tax=Lentilactobacillus hilgardii TaxID=1588 RepID=UPI001CC209DA|nr:type II toxin-antitoxin system HicB family antitoxin [Lentilactobacillus hilgardii]
MMTYLYDALLTFNPEGQVEVTFPDLGFSAATFGTDVPDALHMAHDALEGYLLTAEDYNDKLPNTSDPRTIEHGKDQFLVPIEVNTTIARERENEEKERLHLAKTVYNSKSPILTNPKDIEKYLSEDDNKNHPQ